MSSIIFKKTVVRVATVVGSTSSYTSVSNKTFKDEDEIKQTNSKNIKLVSQRLQHHLFKKQNECNPFPSCSTKSTSEIDFTDRIELPELANAKNLMEHFNRIGDTQFNRFKYI